MKAFLYGLGLQWRLDLRSRTLLITCYLVPLLFFAVMGGIFTSIMPEARNTLIQAMTVMGVSMGAFIGLPPSLVEVYGTDIKKVYKANGVPMFLGLITMYLSTFVHLLIMSGIIYLIAPIAFDAVVPENKLLYFATLAIFIAVSLSIGSVLGLLVKSQAKLTMYSQIFFLPSIMLSGIMFSADLLPSVLRVAGKVFPAAWGFIMMTDNAFRLSNLLPLVVIFAICAVLCGLILHKVQKE